MCIAVCDGLKGLPEAITTEWPLTVVQTYLIHLLRNAFRYASRQYWDEMSRDLRPISPPSTACRGPHRSQRTSGQGTVHRVRQQMRTEISGDRPTVGQRVERERGRSSTTTPRSAGSSVRRM
ncbi:transposase [Rhodococcus opacus]|uniref:transposase n=1 Tax=Rhodococcus opacus TaxID=37919 RepID=UPI001E44F328|nr:transposase [Rhodococcus opacus]